MKGEDKFELAVTGVKGLLFVALIVASFKAGQWLGERNSPDYSSEYAAARFILTNGHPRRTANGGYVVTLRAGPDLYHYNFGTNRLARRQIMADLRDYRPSRRWTLSETNRVEELMGLTALIPGAAVASTSLVGRLGSGVSKGRVYATMALAALIGGFAGYYLSYDDNFDYSNPAFRRVAENPRYYRFLAYEFAHCDRFVRRARPTESTSSRVAAAIASVRERCLETLEFLDEPLGEG